MVSNLESYLPGYEKKILFHQDHLAGRQETAGFELSDVDT
jgi:hypothetical protein